MKPTSYYAELEKKYGLKARRAAETADETAEALEKGEIDFAGALRRAYGAAYRPREGESKTEAAEHREKGRLYAFGSPHI